MLFARVSLGHRGPAAPIDRILPVSARLEVSGLPQAQQRRQPQHQQSQQ